MQASRASTRALKSIAAAGSKQHTRNLHYTGPTSVSSLLTSDRLVVNNSLPRDLPNLRVEFPASESPADIGPAARQFNTSRTLKDTANDLPTYDFAHSLDFDPDAGRAPFSRIPIVTDAIMSENSQAATEQVEVDEAMKLPSIMTAAADGTHIYAPAAMSEVTDNNTVDFQGMVAKVAGNLGKTTAEGAGMARQVWADLMDDVLGPKKGSSAV